MSELGIFVLGFTVTLAVICVADAIMESGVGTK